MPVNPEDMIQLLMKTNADQEECLKEKDQTISDLRATVEELRNTVTDLRSTIANLNETLDEFKRKLFWYFQRKSKAGKIRGSVCTGYRPRRTRLEKDEWRKQEVSLLILFCCRLSGRKCFCRIFVYVCGLPQSASAVYG